MLLGIGFMENIQLLGSQLLKLREDNRLVNKKGEVASGLDNKGVRR